MKVYHRCLLPFLRNTGYTDRRGGICECRTQSAIPSFGRGDNKVEMTNGLALGVLEDFDFQSKKLKMKNGDQLLLYTDGVVEAFNMEEAAYSEDRFENFLNENLQLSPEALIKKSFADVNDFKGSAPQSDDITLLGIIYKG
jgi:phosphoserine phosphatase RsbU/P